jgi:curved DNA-binding protein CbpA
MKTLFDILGAHPDDDAEKLKSAFRKAVKANHPDLNADDPNASMRIKRIINAYTILRDEQKRAAYERWLAFKRGQLRSKPKHAFSYTMRDAASDATAAVGLAGVLVGGYLMCAPASKAPVDLAQAINVVAGHESDKGAAIQSTPRTDTAEQHESGDGPVDAVPYQTSGPSVAPRANSGSPAIADGELFNAFRPSLDQASANMPATHFEKESDVEPGDRKNAWTFGGPLFSPARNNGTPRPSLVELERSSAKRTAGVFGKSRMALKSHGGNPSLENGDTACSGFSSCAGSAPPLFGVSF